jgi:hypothetical protein
MSSARIHGYKHYYGKLKNQDSGLAPSDELVGTCWSFDAERLLHQGHPKKRCVCGPQYGSKEADE